MEYIRSPINYTGCKYKLLPMIEPLFPNKISLFLDVFGGSGTISLNINATNIVYNEFNDKLFNIIKSFKTMDSQDIISHIENRVNQFDLRKGYIKPKTQEEYIENEMIKKNYLCFRNFLNNESDAKELDLLTIHYFAFNNLIRFTKRQPCSYNAPSGVGSKCYSSTNHNIRIDNACTKFKNISILNKDFRDLDYSILSNNDFVYFDPPYLLSNAEYNKIWNEEIEKELYALCDSLTKSNIKWALSNMIVNNNTEHTLLKNWVELNNYNIHFLNTNYLGWICLKKTSYTGTQEVLITNY